MKAEDIVNALQIKLPTLVDDFTLNRPIDSVALLAPSTIEITTVTPHTLVEGNLVYINNVFIPISIDTSTRSGTIGTINTATDHDLTKKGSNPASQPTVFIEGTDQSNFNGEFTIQSIPNRRTINIIMDDSGAIASTGGLGVDIGSPLNAVSGLVTVTNITSTLSFRYQATTVVANDPVLNEASIKSTPRISTAVTFERAVNAYTKQQEQDGWLFVVLQDAIGNKSKDTTIDGIDNLVVSNFFNQKFSQSVDLYVFFTSTASINGRTPGDRCQELILPISQSILFKKFDSLLTAGKLNTMQFTSAGIQEYNTATFVFRYTYEMLHQFSIQDTVQFDEADVAFRDIDLTQFSDIGSGTLTADIDLDDEPLT